MRDILSFPLARETTYSLLNFCRPAASPVLELYAKKIYNSLRSLKYYRTVLKDVIIYNNNTMVEIFVDVGKAYCTMLVKILENN